MTDLQRYFWLGLLGPLLWLQGRHVWRTTPRLPEPTGARSGHSGSGPRLRVLIVGDSAAAGVGAATQHDALSGQLLRYLSPHFSVEWRLLAVTGLDSPGLLRLLQAAEATPVDVVIVSIGVNDVTALTTPKRWVRWQSQLARLVEARFAPKLLVHSAVPPMHAFTALPQPLRRFFGGWACEFNRQLGMVLAGDKRHILHTPFSSTVVNGLATDGFHPGPRAYEAWAQSLGQHILSTWLDAAAKADRPDPAVLAAPR